MIETTIPEPTTTSDTVELVPPETVEEPETDVTEMVREINDAYTAALPYLAKGQRVAAQFEFAKLRELGIDWSDPKFAADKIAGIKAVCDLYLSEVNAKNE